MLCTWGQQFHNVCFPSQLQLWAKLDKYIHSKSHLHGGQNKQDILLKPPSTADTQIYFNHTRTYILKQPVTWLNTAETVHRSFPELSQSISLIAKIHEHLLPLLCLVQIRVTNHFVICQSGKKNDYIQSTGPKSMGLALCSSNSENRKSTHFPRPQSVT